MPTPKRCNKSKYKLHNKTKSKNTSRRTRRGGVSKVIPFKRYGYTRGTTPRSEAIRTLAKESQMQNKNNQMSGGAKSQTRIIVPSFQYSGKSISPYNANTASKLNNTTYTQSKVNSKYDHYAFVNNKKSTQNGGVRSNIKRHKTQNRRKNVNKQSKYTKSRRHNKGGNIENSIYSDFLTWHDAFPNLYITTLTGGSNPISRGCGWPCMS